MSQENVEIVRRAFAEFERGNFWVPEFFDPGIRITWIDPPVGTESETVGLQAMGSFMTSWLEPYENVTLTLDRIVDAGDRVVVVQTWRGEGKTSGVPTEWRQAGVWTLREGRLVDIVGYRDPAEALEAAGLSE